MDVIAKNKWQYKKKTLSYKVYSGRSLRGQYSLYGAQSRRACAVSSSLPFQITKIPVGPSWSSHPMWQNLGKGAPSEMDRRLPRQHRISRAGKMPKNYFYEMRSCSFFVVWCWLCAYMQDLNSPWRCCNPMQNQYISLESQHIRRDSCAMNSSSKFGTLWSGGSCIFLSHY